MQKTELIQLIHDFPDRSIKWLLETPDNLRGLLLIAFKDLAKQINYNQIERIERTFVLENLRKREADMIFKTPFLNVSGESHNEVIIYILIEHQSTIDSMMPFRILSYMVQIWDNQRKEWADKNIPQNKQKLCPILPLVLYTGNQRWDKPLEMRTLMDLSVSLEKYVPQYEISFINLKAMSSENLIEENHPFGWVLRVIQKEDANTNELREVLDQAIKHLDQMPPEEKANWSKLLYFLLMFIYNRRGESERSELIDVIEKNVIDKSRREEVDNMGRTIAQSLIEEGIDKGIERGIERGIEKGIEKGIKLGLHQGMQQLLIETLEIRFEIVPSNLVEAINNITDTKVLKSLQIHAIKCNTIDEFCEKMKSEKKWQKV